MTDAPKELANIYRPSWRERIWRKAGYRYHLGEEPEGVDALHGWMRLDAHLSFNLRDRLRLLLTGKLSVVITTHTNAAAPTIWKSRIDWEIIKPGSGL